MNSNNPVIIHCIEGIRAELEHRPDDARRSYQNAWQSRTNNYEACIAAHCVARVQDLPEESLKWNLVALELAYSVQEDEIGDFYPSLYMSLGASYERLGGKVQAQRYYRLVAGLGEVRHSNKEDESVKLVKDFFVFQPCWV